MTRLYVCSTLASFGAIALYLGAPLWLGLALLVVAPLPLIGGSR